MAYFKKFLNLYEIDSTALLFGLLIFAGIAGLFQIVCRSFQLTNGKIEKFFHVRLWAYQTSNIYAVMFLTQAIVLSVQLKNHIPDIDTKISAVEQKPLNIFNNFFFNEFALLNCISFSLLAFLTFFYLSLFFWKSSTQKSIEFIFILFFACFFCFSILSCNDFILLFFLMEAISFCACLLIASNTFSLFALESAFKYFLLNATASLIFLFSFFWMFLVTNTTHFSKFLIIMTQSSPETIYPIWWVLTLPVGLMITAFLIKLGAFPFNYWTPDIYQGCDNFLIFFLSIPVKSVFLLVLYKLVFKLFFLWHAVFKGVLAYSAIGSFLVGAFGAFRENKISRFLAFSSLNQLGFFLALFAMPFTNSSFVFFYIFFFIYTINSLIFFGVLLSLKKLKSKTDIEYLAEFSGLGSNSPLIAFFLTVALFSFMGIPPLAGFFSKFFVLLDLFQKNGYVLVIVALFGNCVAAYYYLNITALLWFNSKQVYKIKDISSFFLGKKVMQNNAAFFFFLTFINCFFFIIIQQVLNFFNAFNISILN